MQLIAEYSAGNTSSITFSNLPQEFSKIVIIGTTFTNDAYYTGNLRIRFNGSTQSDYRTIEYNQFQTGRNTSNTLLNYLYHQVGGNGANRFTYSMFIHEYSNYQSGKETIWDAIFGNQSGYSEAVAFNGQSSGRLDGNTDALTSLEYFAGNTFQNPRLSVYGV